MSESASESACACACVSTAIGGWSAMAMGDLQSKRKRHGVPAFFVQDMSLVELASVSMPLVVDGRFGLLAACLQHCTGLFGARCLESRFCHAVVNLDSNLSAEQAWCDESEFAVHCHGVRWRGSDLGGRIAYETPHTSLLKCSTPSRKTCVPTLLGLEGLGPGHVVCSLHDL